jgi:hypothetical protein
MSYTFVLETSIKRCEGSSPFSNTVDTLFSKKKFIRIKLFFNQKHKGA